MFSGLFKAIHANEDEYLKYLFSYIHLNPIKLIEPLWKETGIKDRKRASMFLKSYNYSSFLDLTEKQRKEKVILDKNIFPNILKVLKNSKILLKIGSPFLMSRSRLDIDNQKSQAFPLLQRKNFRSGFFVYITSRKIVFVDF